MLIDRALARLCEIVTTLPAAQTTGAATAATDIEATTGAPAAVVADAPSGAEAVATQADEMTAEPTTDAAAAETAGRA